MKIYIHICEHISGHVSDRPQTTFRENLYNRKDIYELVIATIVYRHILMQAALIILTSYSYQNTPTEMRQLTRTAMTKTVVH